MSQIMRDFGYINDPNWVNLKDQYSPESSLCFFLFFVRGRGGGVKADSFNVVNLLSYVIGRLLA